MDELMSIANLVRGAVIEQLDNELNRVLENITDVNTDPEAKRKMTITVTLKPNYDRDEAAIEILTKLGLAPPMPISTRIFIDKDKDGKVVAGELQRGAMAGQEEIDFGTGEVVTKKIFKVK